MYKSKIGLILILFIFITACSTRPTSEVLREVLHGEGVRDSGKYQLDDPGPHKVIVLNHYGHIFQEWQDQLPTSWVASSLKQTEFVIQVSENLVENMDPNSIIYIEIYEVTAWEARSGRKLWVGNIYTQENSLEARVASLVTWLGCRVNTQSCDQIILGGHTEKITSVAISQNDEIIASSSGDEIILYRALDGAILHHLSGHSAYITSISFSPDNSILASSDKDGYVILWDVVSGEKLKAFQAHEERLNAISISREGKYLATGSRDETVKIWGLEDGGLIKSLDACSVEDIAFSMDGDILAAGCSYPRGGEKGQMMFWNVGEFFLQTRIELGSSGVTAIDLSEDGDVAAGIQRGWVIVWQISTGTSINRVDLYHFSFNSGKHDNLIHDLVFTPDGQNLWIAVGGSNDAIWLWPIDKSFPTRELGGHNAGVECLAISSDGSLLVSGSTNGEIRLWRNP